MRHNARPHPRPPRRPDTIAAPNLAHAQQLIQLGRFADAAKVLRGVLAQDPDDPFAHTLLAICAAELEQWPVAIEHADRAVHLAPDAPASWHAKGHVHLEMRQWPEAEAAARETIRLEPGAVDGHALLAAAMASQRRWPETLAAAEEGLQLDPTHDDCTNLRGFALTQLGDAEGAAAALRGQLGRTPSDARTHANRGHTLMHQRQYREAQEHFREALRLDPQSEWAREGLVESLRASHWFYRPILRFLLWMERMSPRAQFGVLIGGYLLYRIVSSEAVSGPMGAWKWLFIGPYFAFCLATWFAPMLLNLVLLLSPLGRIAVTRRETVESVIVVALLGGGVAALTTYVSGIESYAGYLTFVLGVVSGGMAFAVRQLFAMPPTLPRARRWMVGYTLLCLAVGAAWAWFHHANFSELLRLERATPEIEGRFASLQTLLLVFVILCVWVSQFAAVWCAQRLSRIDVRPPRP